MSAPFAAGAFVGGKETAMSTFTCVYDTYPQAEQALRALQSAGVDPSDISLVANHQASAPYTKATEAESVATDAGVGAAIGGGVGLLAGLAGLAIPGVGPVLGVGWLMTTVIGAIAGTATGGFVGVLTETGVPQSHAEVYAEAVRRGGTLLTVRSTLGDEIMLAALNDTNPIDPVVRRAEYEKDGWSRSDQDARDAGMRADEEEVRAMDAERRERIEGEGVVDHVSPAVPGVPFPSSL